MEFKEHAEKVVRKTESKGIHFNNVTQRSLHAAMGLVDEAAEIQNLFKKALFYDKPLDMIHLAEELGDLLWFTNLMIDELGFNVEQLLSANAEKLLNKRYKNGEFEYDAANNRDLAQERAQLEQSLG